MIRVSNVWKNEDEMLVTMELWFNAPPASYSVSSRWIKQKIIPKINKVDHVCGTSIENQFKRLTYQGTVSVEVYILTKITALMLSVVRENSRPPLSM